MDRKLTGYGEIALKAMCIIRNDKKSPQDAWEDASNEIFEAGSSSQRKSCPKNSFLGLCEEGEIKGVKKGCYCKNINNINKKYVIDALNLIRRDESLMNNKTNLWRKITDVSHNQQLDVLFALIEEKYISLNSVP